MSGISKIRIVPDAHNLYALTITGPGEVAGVDNGNPLSHESLVDGQQHIFNGFGLIVIRSLRKPGKIIVKAGSAHLISAEVEITVEKMN